MGTKAETKQAVAPVWETSQVDMADMPRLMGRILAQEAVDRVIEARFAAKRLGLEAELRVALRGNEKGLAALDELMDLHGDQSFQTVDFLVRVAPSLPPVYPPLEDMLQGALQRAGYATPEG